MPPTCLTKVCSDILNSFLSNFASCFTFTGRAINQTTSSSKVLTSLGSSAQRSWDQVPYFWDFGLNPGHHWFKYQTTKTQTIGRLWFLLRSWRLTGRPDDVATVAMTTDKFSTITHKIQRLHVLQCRPQHWNSFHTCIMNEKCPQKRSRQ